MTEFTQSGTYETNYEYDIQGNLLKTIDAQDNVIQISYDSFGRKTSMDDPDMGVWSYNYDEVGNLVSQTDAKGQIIEFEYDIINRLIQKDFPNSPQAQAVVYTYDDTDKDNCIGRLSRVEDSFGQTEFFYDKLGREIKSIKTVDSTNYTVERTYDILDRLTTLKYPDGEVVNYTYDTNSGNLETVTGLSNYVEDITYDAQGKIKDISYGNNTQTDYTYGNDLRLSQILTQNQTETLQELHYDFDKNGNLTTLTDNLRSNIRTFSYDDLDRLTQAQNIPNQSGSYTTFNYQYDSIGNMTYKSDLGVMEYGQGAGPHAVTAAAAAYSYSYDANGNMIEGKNKLMSYDSENRLIELNESGIITTTFVYDGDGGRVKKLRDDGSIQTETIYIGSLYEITNGSIKKHIFAGSNKVCTIEPEHTYYTHSDHLGSSNVITDESGAKASQTEYQPYGKISEQIGDSVTNYKFTGKELDSTGLYYYGARYYDSEIGRFITPDSIVQSPYDPQTLNRYAYCRNNPLIYIDPSGHSIYDIFYDPWDDYEFGGYTGSPYDDPWDDYEFGGHTGSPYNNSNYNDSGWGWNDRFDSGNPGPYNPVGNPIDPTPQTNTNNSSVVESSALQSQNYGTNLWNKLAVVKDETSLAYHFWDTAWEERIWEQWHIDVGYSGRIPTGLKAGISAGFKVDMHGLYIYHSPGLGKGAGLSATFVSGRANAEVAGVHTWVKGGTGVFGISARGGIKKGENGAQVTGAIGAGLGIGKGVSVGARQIFQLLKW